MQNSTPYILEVRPRVPERLARLEELANNLWYSWDLPTRDLFSHIHRSLWDAVGQNPNAFLRRVNEQRLIEASEDPIFLASYNRVLAAYDSYHTKPVRNSYTEGFAENDLVAYFCAEFGFHESFPIYSGGLGILAGDHCKSASDMHLPFVGVGLLYRRGYFHQTIDSDGNQNAIYTDSDFENLPISPVLRGDGQEFRVSAELPGRSVAIKIWQARIGNVTLYLLDTDLAENSPHDRIITHHLYGGDKAMRIEQEIVLGIGGVRALAEMGFAPTAWHINEGHAAFMSLERIRILVGNGMDFAGALEAAAANTIFTTHTPVPAGHDHFNHGMLLSYFEQYYPQLKISREDFLALGRSPDTPDFNMTSLAIRCSRFQNGVSRIHGKVSSRICAEMWPEIEEEENPMSYITNGVHMPTFLAKEWLEVFERFLGWGWSQHCCDVDFWKQIDGIPDHQFWSVRETLKSRLLQLIRQIVSQQHYRNHGSEAHLDRILKYADPANPNVLTIGFARRFATYKRASLLFENLDWLRQIMGDAERPVLFIFAGKAHPADIPGQDLIRRVTQVSRLPEFEGKILMLEGYDLRLSRRLVAGVDVWLNNPLYPLEASGTSGMKAGMNGVLNLSVLDGWWDEGYGGRNGWAIKPVSELLPEAQRNREESHTLYELLQDQVIPTFYNRNKMGYSQEWVAMSKSSIATLLPRFNSTRMVGEYVAKTYLPAVRQQRRFHGASFGGARQVATWKSAIRHAWQGVAIRLLNTPKQSVMFREGVRFEVSVKLNGLKPGDVVVEMLIGYLINGKEIRPSMKSKYKFQPQHDMPESGEHVFALELMPAQCGKLGYRIRVYPHHDSLVHPLELGCMRWL
ncbi:MAG: alpha-glucan family phosphorylase [Nitrosomonadales bacterium]|nr:alpha-glucan family phosphorylase [Nitrosomonadales bacterium]